jgi:RNA polymerase sigma factor (sigma-70 family)
MHVIPDKKTEDMENNIVNKIVLHDAIRTQLNWREKIIVIYRFYFDLDQTTIGNLVGISQVHCHRMLDKSLSKIRNYMTK